MSRRKGVKARRERGKEIRNEGVVAEKGGREER